MVRISFQIYSQTNFGETLKVVGSAKCLGEWNIGSAISLNTSSSTYPFWTSDEVDVQLPFEYKYIKMSVSGEVIWEDGATNRTLPEGQCKSSDRWVVFDGGFNYIQVEPFGYPSGANVSSPGSLVPANPSNADGLRVLVFGSSVSAGHKAWKFRGWAEMLGETLYSRYGHGFINVGVAGINSSRALELFNEQVAAKKPNIVILAFGLGNEGLPHCPPHERAHVYQGFLGRLSELIAQVHRLGALPVLGGVYPHGDYSADHFYWIKQASEEMRKFNVPVLEWLDVLVRSDGSGRWAEGVDFDPSHPNTEGHRRMFSSIDLNIFASKVVKENVKLRSNKVLGASDAKSMFDNGEFKILSHGQHEECCQICIVNDSKQNYMLNPDWHELQQSLQKVRNQHPGILKDGLYISDDPRNGVGFVAIASHGGIESRLDIPAQSRHTFRHVSSFFRPPTHSQVLFYDGNLLLFQESEAFVLLNETTVEYNVHPMWQELRIASRKLPHGLYEDGTGRPFSSAVISKHGLSSRVKVPARSGVRLSLKKTLEDVELIGLLPVGDRCSVRMLLHKIEYDGPCYPFDLARCMAASDASDILRNNFQGMWDPSQLVWDSAQGRLFHTKWHSLSFAHEVEDGDDPDNDLGPVFARMAKRYSGRAARFNYACKNATRLLFVRTGCASRAEVEDLVQSLASTFKVKPQLLLVSDQPSDEFANLDGVTHVREGFNPDRMYEDEQYWFHCAHRFRTILENAGVSTANLYWCPNDLAEAEREASEPLPDKAFNTCNVKHLSHSNLFKIINS